MFGLAIGSALWLLFASPLPAADLKDALAPGGTLRAAFLGGNPVQGRVDAASGAVTGPVAELVQELSRRLGVPFRFAPSPDVRGVMEAVKTHAADLGFLAFDTSRAAEVDFAQPYALAYNSHIVTAGSALKSAEDIARGRRDRRLRRQRQCLTEMAARFPVCACFRTTSSLSSRP